MAPITSTDLLIGFMAIVLAGAIIFMFHRATSGESKSKQNEKEKESESIIEEPIKLEIDKKRVKIPNIKPLAKDLEIEKARSNIRTLTLKQEILSMVMKRLFEAEDDNEISSEEREALSKSYESEMKHVQEELNRAELIVSLNELENIRTNIIKQFEDTLNTTQTKIDLIIKELNIETPKAEEPKPKPKKPPRRRRRPKRPPESETTEESEEEEETRQRDSVEDRLDKLKQDVLKELEELDRLELEA